MVAFEELSTTSTQRRGCGHGEAARLATTTRRQRSGA